MEDSWKVYDLLSSSGLRECAESNLSSYERICYVWSGIQTSCGPSSRHIHLNLKVNSLELHCGPLFTAPPSPLIYANFVASVNLTHVSRDVRNLSRVKSFCGIKREIARDRRYPSYQINGKIFSGSFPHTFRKLFSKLFWSKFCYNFSFLNIFFDYVYIYIWDYVYRCG